LRASELPHIRSLFEHDAWALVFSAIDNLSTQPKVLILMRVQFL
jgi:hypothetical protein